MGLETDNNIPTISMVLLGVKVLQSYMKNNSKRTSKLIDLDLIPLLFSIAFHSRVIGKEALEMIKDIVSILGKTKLEILLN
jgi:hypothetical protein